MTISSHVIEVKIFWRGGIFRNKNLIRDLTID